MTTSRAFGFAVVGGGAAQGAIQVLIPSSDTNNMGIGDPVVLLGNAGSSSNGRVSPTAGMAAATGALFGYIDSIDGTDAASVNFNQSYRPASTAMYAQVIPFQPNVEYKILADSSAALTTANVGNNANLSTIVGCDTITGLSKNTLSSTSAANSQTAYQMTITGVTDDGSNVITATTPILKVMINNIQVFPGFGGV